MAASRTGSTALASLAARHYLLPDLIGPPAGRGAARIAALRAVPTACQGEPGRVRQSQEEPGRAREVGRLPEDGSEASAELNTVKVALNYTALCTAQLKNVLGTLPGLGTAASL